MQANIDISDKFYTIPEVSAKIGFCLSHTYNLVNSGDIKTEKRRSRPGSRRMVVVVTQAELDRLTKELSSPVGV